MAGFQVAAEVSIAQGTDGLLWLAAKDGLYRFDGFHYQKIEEYPFQSARYVAATMDGSIWAGDYQGLARLRNRKFEIVMTRGVITLAAYPEKLFVRTEPFDMSEIRLDGSIRQFNFPARRDLSVDSSGRLWAVCVRPDMGCWIDPRRPEEVHKFAMPGDAEALFSDFKGDIWLATDTEAQVFQSNRLVRKFQRNPARESDRRGPLLPGRNGQLWFLGDAIQGFFPPALFRDTTASQMHPPLAGYEDPQGHLWVSLLGHGLVQWSVDPQWQRWPSGDFSNEVLDFVIHDQHRDPILATHRNLYRLNPGTGNWEKQFKEERQYDGLLALDDGGFLASVRHVGVVRLSPEGKIIQRLKDSAPKAEHRKIVRDRKGRIWVGAKRVLLQVEGSGNGLHFREQHLPGMRPLGGESPVDMELDINGRLWVGYSNGIAWIDEQDQWHQILTDKPVTAVRSFALAGDDIWVAHRRAGGFSRLRRNGDTWKVTELTTSLGYNPADTEFIKSDSRGWIWRGTPEGVYVSDGRHFGPDDWLHISVRNGLAGDDSNQYGFLEESDGSVWVVAEDGLTKLHPDPAWFGAPTGATAPRITNIEADGKANYFPNDTTFRAPSDTKSLHIETGTLVASPFQDKPLRYRLLPVVKEWQLSGSGTFEFHSLPEGAYSLEVGYAGAGRSAVASYSFSIGNPAWSAGLSRRAGLLLAGTLALMLTLLPLLRLTPALEGPRFRVEKALFLLRRRFSRRQFQSPGSEGEEPANYCGETLRERYAIRRIISRGGFSTVYEAYDLSQENSKCAVKVLTRASRSAGWVRDRFAHEVAALRSLNHPNVIPILDSWIAPGGEPCIAMPFLEGPTLRAALEGPLFSPGRIGRIVERLGSALAMVHAHGIVHRDLKPENLILVGAGTTQEEPVIIDFGTAGLRSAENELAATTLMAGSFHYMAPERLTGHYSPASDVFSFAVVILEMLTRKRLSDVGVGFSDPAFPNELKALLGSVNPSFLATCLPQLLSQGFEVEPKRRPSKVGEWSLEISRHLRELSASDCVSESAF